MSDWTTTDLRQKSIAAKEYTDYANVPVGSDTYELPYSLLGAEQQLEVQSKIDLSSIAEMDGEVEMDEELEQAEEIVQELQSKDDLTDKEEEKLRENQLVLAKNEGKLMDALGKETLVAFHDAGRAAISPDREDVENVMESPVASIDRFEDIDSAPTPSNGEWTREMARRAIRREMLHIFDDNPLMIYFTIGQQVWEESQSAGNLVENSDDET